QSIYDYCIITEERKEYLWSSKNYSSVSHHTGQFLGEEIINVVEDIDPEKIAAIVSDNAANIKGGDLKDHTKTRWSTMWDCINSIVRLEFAFVRVLSEHENDLKPRIKDILCDRIFYEDCRLIVSILHPLKISVGCLESRTSNLADCYVHLVSLANAIFRVPNQNIAFKNYCIEKFNRRWDEFSNNIYILTFFLHPRYH
ncbi:22299_t:CDS:2, partial [Cetraspora pellucida]